MVETELLYKMGLDSGAIDGDGIMVGVSQGWKMIEAPLSSDTSSYSLIFWEPTDQEDCKPTLEKIVCDSILPPFYSQLRCVKVGACIYGAGKISPLFGNRNSDYIGLQCKAAVHNLR